MDSYDHLLLSHFEFVLSFVSVFALNLRAAQLIVVKKLSCPSLYWLLLCVQASSTYVLFPRSPISLMCCLHSLMCSRISSSQLPPPSALLPSGTATFAVLTRWLPAPLLRPGIAKFPANKITIRYALFNRIILTALFYNH